jgi:hypothetical protein
MSNINGFINYEDEEYDERRRLVDKLILHVIPRTNCSFTNMEEHLYNTWCDVVESFQIDHEYRYVCRNEEFVTQAQEPWEDEIEEIRRANKNSDSWINNARKKYEDITRVLYSIILDQSSYPKHYPNPNWTIDDMLRHSSKEAILGKNMTLDIQDRIYCEIVNKFWAELVSNTMLTYIVQTRNIIGFSKGMECNYLVFRIDAINNQVHCYPINKSELKENIKEYLFNPNDVFKYINPYEIDENVIKQNYLLTTII